MASERHPHASSSLTRRQAIALTAGTGMAAAAMPAAIASAQVAAPEGSTTIVNARIFDGRWLLAADSLVIDADGRIAALGTGLPPEGSIVDAGGGTLMPGLIDASTHTSPLSLALGLRFGVTTELEMMGMWSSELRRSVAQADALADLRTALYAVTPKGGHPTELLPADSPMHDNGVATPDEARAHVRQMVEQGADYIEVMIEEGTVLGHPGLPVPSPETVRAAVDEAHRHGKLVIAHAFTAEAVRKAIDGGVDGLTHFMIDEAATPQIARTLAARGMFVVPCNVVSASILGRSGAALAADPRVRARLPAIWRETLSASIASYDGQTPDILLRSMRALGDAGVTTLVGTDSAFPSPSVGGVAHGASVHAEMGFFVDAGWSPAEAIAAATSETARAFDLGDRSRIAPSMRADLLLVDGDPQSDMGDSLSIRRVWKRGVELTDEAVSASDRRLQALPTQ